MRSQTYKNNARTRIAPVGGYDACAVPRRNVPRRFSSEEYAAYGYKYARVGVGEMGWWYMLTPRLHARATLRRQRSRTGELQ